MFNELKKIFGSKFNRLKNNIFEIKKAINNVRGYL